MSWSSTAQSFREAGMVGLAPLITAPIAGEIYDVWGPEAAFLFGAAVAGLGVLVLVLAKLSGKFDSGKIQDS